MLKVVAIITLTNLLFVESKIRNDECGLKNIVCGKNDLFRSIDGSCNNLKNPAWGTKYSVYDRILPPEYSDGVHSFPRTKNGKELPNARNISNTVYIHALVETVSKYSLITMQYGQVLSNDMSLTYLPIPLTDCCTKYLQYFDKTEEPQGCANIRIPSDDSSYASINATCIPMPRTITNRDLYCSKSLGYEEKISIVNNYVDLSVIYGNTYEDHKTLRTFKNGTLLVEIRNNREWLPSSNNPLNDCPGNGNAKDKCYRSGDPRLNQHPQLAVLITLLVRNHNKIARELKHLNPHWNDHRLFEETRRINIAEHQHVSFNELLPMYFGRGNLIKHKILYETNDFVDDYDITMRPNVFNEHAHGAFRQFHSLMPGKLSLFNADGQMYDSLIVRDHYERPISLEKYEIFDGYIRGLAWQPQMESDKYLDPEFTRLLSLRYLKFGLDLKSIGIQRSRDHGVSSYNKMRAHCGLKKAKSMDDFSDVINKENLDQLKTFYEHPDDVELIVGGSLETNVKGALAGPTFLCIMLKQFYRTRTSDRFWYENENNGFTLEQLSEIRKFTVAKLFCDNGNNITHMQKHAFFLVSDKNPLYPCNEIEGPNFNLWREQL